MNLSLREMDRIYAHMRLVLQSYDKKHMIYISVLLLLIYIRKNDLHFYNQIKNRSLSLQELVDYFESTAYKDVFTFDNRFDNSARYSLFAFVEFISLYSSAGLNNQQFKMLSDDGKSLTFECKVLNKEKIIEIINQYMVLSSYEYLSLHFAHIEFLAALQD